MLWSDGIVPDSEERVEESEQDVEHDESERGRNRAMRQEGAGAGLGFDHADDVLSWMVDSELKSSSD